VSEREPAPSVTPDDARTHMLIEAGLALSSELDLGSVLERIVELALERAASRPTHQLRPEDLP